MPRKSRTNDNDNENTPEVPEMSAPTLDLSALAASVEDAPEETLTRSGNGGGGRPKADNPFDAPVLAARQDGKVKTLTVPTEAAATVSGLIRRAAYDNGFGIKVRTAENDNGTVTIKYETKDGRENRSVECPECHKPVTVTAEGKVRKHGARGETPCAGSGTDAPVSE